MVNIGNTFAHEISQELNSVTNLPRMPTGYQQEGDSASHDINSLIDTALAVPAAITATTAAETIAQPTIAGGKIPTKNHKKKNHSLKKKHLFKQKTLRIRNRLHKLLIN
jgi:hypothetical protein